VPGHAGRLEVRHLKTMGPLPYLWDLWELVPASAPRLELGEVLRAAQPGTLFMLDVKGTAEVGADVAAAAVAAVHEVAPGHDVIVCSRVWPAVEAVSELPYVRPVLSARTRRELAALRPRVRASRVYGVSVHRSLLTPALVQELHRSVEVVMTWPVNTGAALRETLALGVTGVISDELAVLDRLPRG
jgi:glycerophosphoryl diester phosphodiesterase